MSSFKAGGAEISNLVNCLHSIIIDVLADLNKSWIP